MDHLQNKLATYFTAAINRRYCPCEVTMQKYAACRSSVLKTPWWKTLLVLMVYIGDIERMENVKKWLGYKRHGCAAFQVKLQRVLSRLHPIKAPSCFMDWSRIDMAEHVALRSAVKYIYSSINFRSFNTDTVVWSVLRIQPNDHCFKKAIITIIVITNGYSRLFLLSCKFRPKLNGALWSSLS